MLTATMWNCNVYDATKYWSEYLSQIRFA